MPPAATKSPITTDGSEKERIKYGTASWVYGEELSQTTAMWWSPDSARIAYYRFDEQNVPDYFLQMDQTKLQSTVDHRSVSESRRAEPGRRSLRVRRCHRGRPHASTCATGKPFDNSVVGHYVYHVAWSPDGTELLVQSHQPPAEHPRIRRRQSGDRR